jgi:hypothetical protein
MGDIFGSWANFIVFDISVYGPWETTCLRLSNVVTENVCRVVDGSVKYLLHAN